MLGLFLCMTLFPEAQKKAQAEIDAVVGLDRLPTLADRPNLPYIDAVVSEMMRWAPVVPMGEPSVFSFNGSKSLIGMLSCSYPA